MQAARRSEQFGNAAMTDAMAPGNIPFATMRQAGKTVREKLGGKNRAELDVKAFQALDELLEE